MTPPILPLSVGRIGVLFSLLRYFPFWNWKGSCQIRLGPTSSIASSPFHELHSFHIIRKASKQLLRALMTLIAFGASYQPPSLPLNPVSQRASFPHVRLSILTHSSGCRLPDYLTCHNGGLRLDSHLEKET